MWNQNEDLKNQVLPGILFARRIRSWNLYRLASWGYKDVAAMLHSGAYCQILRHEQGRHAKAMHNWDTKGNER
jgi:hypothetical protein